MENSPAQQLKNWCEASDLQCVYTQSTGSTNDDAKKHKTPMGPTFFVTEHQTNGRGRGKNQWLDTAGEQLSMTLLLQLEEPPQHLTAPLIGLAVHRALKQFSQKVSVSIKPPNDIYIGAKKLAGLLVEVQSKPNDHRLVIGFGMNVSGHPKEMESATHLNEHLADYDNLNVFFDAFSSHIQNLMPDFSAKELSADVRTELLSAMQMAPFENPLTDLTAQGDLVFAEETISWRDL